MNGKRSTFDLATVVFAVLFGLISPPGALAGPLAPEPPSAVTLAWDPVPEATLYRLEVAVSGTFAPSSILVEFRNLPMSFAVIDSLPAGGVFYWRVWAGNEAGWSEPAEGPPFVVEPEYGIWPLAEPVPEGGVWASADGQVYLLIQKYDTGSCFLILSGLGAPYSAFLDPDCLDGVEGVDDVDRRGYVLNLALMDSRHGILWMTRPDAEAVSAAIELKYPHVH